MRSFIKFRWLFLLMLVLLTACRTDSQEEALEKARAFTLEHTRMLPETTRNYIRYAAPTVQIGNIFGHHGLTLFEYAHLPRNTVYTPQTNAGLDLISANFVWTPPETGYSVIAIGHGQRDLQYWEPLKVILKNPQPVCAVYEAAKSAASDYAVNNMLYLSRMENVRVRYSEAEIRETSFDLEYMFDEQLEGGAEEWKNFLDSLKKKRDRRQYSVIWQADDPAKRIVIAGFGSTDGPAGWTPASGMIIPASQLNEYTIGIYQKGPDETGKPENRP